VLGNDVATAVLIVFINPKELGLPIRTTNEPIPLLDLLAITGLGDEVTPIITGL
jgi:hypothetical protein